MNNYTLTEEIGRGKYSVVYKGRKKYTIEYYAIKSVEKQHREKVMNEVSIMHQLSHPNTLKFWNWYETPNHLWLIVEYCTGGDLMNLLKQDTKFPECSILMLAEDMLKGLQYMHSNGIILCDLKPSNILFNGSGTLKFCDFGYSRRIADLSEDDHQRDRNSIVNGKWGTPCYMAPELFNEDGIYSFASDFWSFGCVMYELAASQPPFVSQSLNELINMIMYQPVQPISDMSIEFNDLIDKLLKKPPEHRLGWDKLLGHKLWNFKIDILPVPPQPHFERYLARKAQKVKDQPVPTDSANQDDVQTLSKIVSRNLEKERENTTYELSHRDIYENNDVVLNNIDSELNFEAKFGSTGSQGSVKEAPVINTPPAEDSQNEKSIEVFDSPAEVEIEANAKDFGSLNPLSKVSPSGGGNRELPKSRIVSEKEEPLFVATGKRRVQSAHAQMENPANNLIITNLDRNGSSSTPPTPKSESSTPLAGTPSGVSKGKALPALKRVPSARTRTGSGAKNSPRSGSPNQSMSLHKLLFHSSDKVVRPIVDSIVPDLTQIQFPKETPFTPLPASRLLALPQNELEAFLTSVYRGVADKTPISSKLVYLDYFETLCVDTKCANLLINSTLLKLFTNMLRVAKSPPLKAKLLRVVGLLIRHATYISETVKSLNLISILSETAMREKDEAVRRSAISSLGELIFYVSTQENQEDWNIPSATIIAMLTKFLKQGEDELVQEYIAQTIENIATSTTNSAKMFASQDNTILLLEIFLATRSESLRATCISAVTRICRHNPQVLQYMVEKRDTKLIMEHLSDGNSKVEQCFLNFINMTLLECPHRMHAVIGDEVAFVGVLRNLLEHSQSVIRAKALLLLHLTTKMEPYIFLLCCQNKVLPILERIARDKESYVRCCMRLALQTVFDLVPSITSKITTEIKKMTMEPGKRMTSQNVKVLKDHLKYAPIVSHLMTSPFLRTRIFNQQLIKDLSFYITMIEELNFLAPEDFKSTVLLILEAISQNPSIMLDHHQDIIPNLLPALITLLKSENGDTRFFCLKIFIDMMSELLNQPNVYNPGQASDSTITTKQLNDLITKQLLPHYKQLLMDEDPIPPFGLKLLNIILQRNTVFVTLIHKLQLIPFFFKFFQLDHPNNNVHNVKLIKKIVESPDIDKQIIYDLGIVRKVSSVLECAYNKAADSFLEPVLDIVYNLFYYSSKKVEFQNYNKTLLDHIPIFVKLMLHNDPQISEKASRCFAVIPKIYGDGAFPLLIESANIPNIITALMHSSVSVQKTILSTFKYLCSSPKIAMQLKSDQELIKALKSMKASKAVALVDELLQAM